MAPHHLTAATTARRELRLVQIATTWTTGVIYRVLADGKDTGALAVISSNERQPHTVYTREKVDRATTLSEYPFRDLSEMAAYLKRRYGT